MNFDQLDKEQFLRLDRNMNAESVLLHEELTEMKQRRQNLRKELRARTNRASRPSSPMSRSLCATPNFS